MLSIAASQFQPLALYGLSGRHCQDQFPSPEPRVAPKSCCDSKTRKKKKENVIYQFYSSSYFLYDILYNLIPPHQEMTNTAGCNIPGYGAHTFNCGAYLHRAWYGSAPTQGCPPEGPAPLAVELILGHWGAQTFACQGSLLLAMVLEHVTVMLIRSCTRTWMWWGITRSTRYDQLQSNWPQRAEFWGCTTKLSTFTWAK